MMNSQPTEKPRSDCLKEKIREYFPEADCDLIAEEIRSLAACSRADEMDILHMLQAAYVAFAKIEEIRSSD